MARKNIEISRRDFLKTSAALGVGALAAPYIHSNAFAATRDRVTVYLAIGCGHCAYCLDGERMLCPDWKCVGLALNGRVGGV